MRISENHGKFQDFSEEKQRCLRTLADRLNKYGISQWATEWDVRPYLEKDADIPSNIFDVNPILEGFYDRMTKGISDFLSYFSRKSVGQWLREMDTTLVFNEMPPTYHEGYKLGFMLFDDEPVERSRNLFDLQQAELSALKELNPEDNLRWATYYVGYKKRLRRDADRPENE